MDYRPYKLAHLQIKLISAKLSTEEALEAVANLMCARGVLSNRVYHASTLREINSLFALWKKNYTPHLFGGFNV